MTPEDQYRAAWESYVLTSDPEQKMALEWLMDSLQTQIADGPKDPRWQSFIDTLPGFREFWDSMRVRAEKLLDEFETQGGRKEEA